MSTRRIQDQTRNNSRTSSIIGLTGYSLLALGVIGLLSTTPRVLAVTESDEGQHELLSGDRILHGTVQEIKGGQGHLSYR